MPSPPEIHASPPATRHIPSSPLPFLIYRSALPTPPSDTTTRASIESNGWFHGGTFKTFARCHFHSVTHECYAVVRGGSLLKVGARGRGVGPRGEGDDDYDGVMGRETREEEEEEGGVQVEVGVGDVIVLPAGVSHYSITSYGDYEYLGLYPQGSPHWDNNFCDADEQETAEKATTCRKVALPTTDPIFGDGGPLVGIWKRAAEEADPRVWK